jgi:predicted outer membrane protein
MADWKHTGLLFGIAATMGACASSPAPSPVNGRPVESTTTVARAPTGEMTTVTSVTSALVAAPVNDPTAPVMAERKSRWTDAQIVRALGAALEGREDEMKAVRTRATSARVDRFATDLLMDERQFTHEQSSLAKSVGSDGSDLERRVGALRDEIGTPNPKSFDHDFLAAEVAYERGLLHLIEDEMMPSAFDPQLRETLAAMRGKTHARLLTAEEAQQHMR